MPSKYPGQNPIAIMVGEPLVVLVRPAKSKVLQIRDPSSCEMQPTYVLQLPTSAYPDLLLSTIEESDRTLKPSADTSDDKATQLKEDLNDGRLKFDVYARPFVPQSLTIINKLNGHVMATQPTKRIHFGAYVGSYVGSDILSPFPTPIQPPNVSPDAVSYTHYELYFRYHLEAEFQAQQQENAIYSLYGHEVTLIQDAAHTMCSFTVPGLRENNPYIEEDDLIQLRQLRYDYMGKPLGMDHWLARGCVNGFPAPGWTGILHNARAAVVQRKQELLVVRVCGLSAQNMNLSTINSVSSSGPFKFNVQFPVPKDRYLPMHQALTIVQKTLREPNKKNTNIHTARALYSITRPKLKVSPPSEGSSTTIRPWLQSMLFPTEENCEVQTALNLGSFKRIFLDDDLNWEQKKAIDSACSYNYGTLPFLISGPPGTGKTKTLVEIAAQLLKSIDKVSHILFCAPSDPAADTIIQRISAHFKPTELLRLNRPSRTFAEVPGAVLPFCHVLQNKFDLPPFKQLMAYKLVVTTCRDASLLLYSRLTNSDLHVAENSMRSSIHPFDAQPSHIALHWNALIMDESAQAIEPEALIPLSVVAPPLDFPELEFTPLFILAGDEHQLGPRTSLRSSPLRTSLFGRLFARAVYADHPLARCKTGTALPALTQTMLPIARPPFANLIRNYRSHPAILAVPSALFYADTLEPEATDIHRLAGWSEWQGRRWPVLFRNNDSDDDLETDGGGWYNVGEARIACQYAAQLVHTGLVQQNDVCIMSPFKAQVQCLRKTIQETRYGSLWDVDIGPTEAFQGLERGVVILCTTRSRQKYVEKDREVDWGIIGLPNKMNVALTRAKFGLIVIGKEDILVQDLNWKAFLDFCGRNGLVAGKTNNDDDDRVQSRGLQLTRLEKVLLTRERDQNDPRVLNVMSQEDEMWTHGMLAALAVQREDDAGYDDDEEEDK